MMTDPFPLRDVNLVCEPPSIAFLQTLDLSHHSLVEYVLKEVINERLLKKMELWCDEIKDTPREHVSDQWISAISKLHLFLELTVENACSGNKESTKRLWEEITDAFLNHDCMDDFKYITKRVFKYNVQVYRNSNTNNNRNKNLTPDEQQHYKYILQLKQCIHFLCEYNQLRLRPLIEECLATALTEVTNVSVIRHCANLTKDTIFAGIVIDTEFLHEYLYFFNAHFGEMGSLLRAYAIKAFIHHLISRCYELIVLDYPKTKMTLVQLMKAMKAIEWYGRKELVEKLIIEIQKRLLQTGVSTKQILNSYANVVESLTFFDSSFVLVHRVCNVIKDYVITRPDTIKTIIKFITVERPGENSSNFCNLIFSENQLASVNDEYVLAIEETTKKSWDKWQPDPHDANPYESRLFRQSADVFSMLVMIYGSKEMFVKEYHEFLSARLVQNGWHRRFKEEVSYVDMMKNRFHDGELTQCEVMLKDIEDSRLFCKDFFEGALDLRVISKEYWPPQEDMKFPGHSDFNDLRGKLEKLFELSRKQTRKLRWYDNYGSWIELNMQMGSVNVNANIPMKQYYVIVFFIEKERHSVAELVVNLNWEKHVVTEAIDWWVQHGCLTLEGGFVSLNEDEGAWAKFQQTMDEQKKKQEQKADGDDESEEEDDEGDDDGSNPRIEYMESFWDYTKNMMKISSRPHQGQFIQPVTAERLLNIFRMLSSPGKPPVTLEEVNIFMNRKIRANMVFVENGVYKLTPEFLTSLV